MKPLPRALILVSGLVLALYAAVLAGARIGRNSHHALAAEIAGLSAQLALARGCDRSVLWLFNGGPKTATCVPRTGPTLAYTFAPGTPVAVPALDYECRGVGGETRLSVVSCPPEGSAEAVARGAVIAAMPARAVPPAKEARR